jgi:hypothetical protein
VRRQKVNAGLEYKKGNRKEAYELWTKAADGQRALQTKKKKNKLGREEPSEEVAAEPKEEGGES